MEEVMQMENMMMEVGHLLIDRNSATKAITECNKKLTPLKKEIATKMDQIDSSAYVVKVPLHGGGHKNVQFLCKDENKTLALTGDWLGEMYAEAKLNNIETSRFAQTVIERHKTGGGIRRSLKTTLLD